MSNQNTLPRMVIAALKGGAGKTFLSTGIVAALRRKGLSVAVFKKGPDYIDAGWLGLAAGGLCYNLDTYLMLPEIVMASFQTRSIGKQLAVVEGNRGLFDGVNMEGTYSTAELAKQLRAPVVLVLDATKTTRTAAALVLGCQTMDPGLAIRGVILNRVAGERHEKILRQSIEDATSIPVVGSVRKLPVTHFPQRHLGLLPLHEHPLADKLIEEAADLAERSVDLDAVVQLASEADSLSTDGISDIRRADHQGTRHGLRIGIVKDSAFQFYYPENVEALADANGSLIQVSALEHRPLPELDALYIGGGFPETHAERLAENMVFKNSLLKAVENGLPVYAECGGLMYLARSLRMDDHAYPMAGVFPVDTALERKPRGLGYIHVEVDRPNPFYPEGTVLTGHEFHYSSVDKQEDLGARCVFRVLRGHGMDGSRDGISRLNALGTYMHVHALGQPLWAGGILARAKAYRAASALNRGTTPDNS